MHGSFLTQGATEMTDRISFIVTTDRPKQYTKGSVADYIRDAVRSYSGSFHPDDEFFGFFKNATVKPLPEKTLGNRKQRR